MGVRVLQAGDLAILPLADVDPSITDHLRPGANWALEADRAWGCCGVAATREGRIVGFALISPALFLPREHPAAKGPQSAAAAVLLAVWVEPESRRAGVGRQLIQHLAARTYGKHDTEAIEAVGSRSAVTTSAPPVSWLLAVGFQPLDARTTRPRYRLELSSAVPWLDLRAAWRRVIAWVPHPIAPPEPAGGAGLAA